MKNAWIILFFIPYLKFIEPQSNSLCEIIYQYECGNKFHRYNLDNEPAEYGISAGQYAPGKDSYIALSVYGDVAYQINPLQLDPPGITVFNTAGPASFSNDTNKIWFLVNDKNHEYTWVDSKNAEIPPFAIKVGEDRNEPYLLIGRIKLFNGFVTIGVVVPFAGYMFFADEKGQSQSVNTGYQVLTCKSSVQNETKYLTPKYDFPPNKDADTGCINNWQSYKNDDAPAINGIEAGEYDCNNTAYVGKAKGDGVIIPGRIQVSPESGFILTSGGNSVFITNGSYYLVNNPSYTYYWTPFDGKSLPNNTVYARNDVGSWKYGVGRVKVNGQTLVGKIAYPALLVPNTKGVDILYSDYEILVCNPEPKFQCGQNWKTINKSDNTISLNIDGFYLDTVNSSKSVFIGRKCSVSDSSEIIAIGNFENSSNVEYLVKNSSYTYKWQPSRSGVKVVNALELYKEGHQPFYIGMTRINDNVVVGKVRPGEGLFFIDPITGKQQSTSSYEVLTCTSPDASNGVYEEESDEDWYGDHWCPAGKKWNIQKSKCVLI